MSIAAKGAAYADPSEHGRLGREVQEVLNALVHQAQRVGTCDAEQETRLALHMASFAASRLSDLADRAEEVGRLCPAVEKELMLAESFMAAVSVRTLTWTLGDDERPFLGSDETGETVRTRISRREYVQALMCIVMSIKQGFPGNTAKRWMAMARAAEKNSAVNGTMP